MTDGSIIATIITVHMVRNIAARSSADWFPIAIQAIDIDQPPGIGIRPDIRPASRTVIAQAATVTTPAMENALADVFMMFSDAVAGLRRWSDRGSRSNA